LGIAVLVLLEFLRIVKAAEPAVLSGWRPGIALVMVLFFWRKLIVDWRLSAMLGRLGTEAVELPEQWINHREVEWLSVGILIAAFILFISY
jgi:hypothetical protein